MMQTLEEQLANTKKSLDAIKAEYEEFAYIVSHDLSAPFRSIEGFSKIIAENHQQDFDDKTNKHFSFIHAGVEEGKNVVESVLQLSRLNTRSEPFTQVDCNALLNEAEASLSELMTLSNAKITKQDLPTVHAEKKQLGIVFYHLLKNALLYQPQQKQAHIAISVSQTADHWQFCFKDNGIGIPDKIADRIFKVLRRGVDHDEYPGEGMGLALAQNVIRRHGGRIWFDSVEGEGAAFYFTIEKEEEVNLSD